MKVYSIQPSEKIQNCLVWKQPVRILYSPAPLLKQGQLVYVVENHVQTSCENFHTQQFYNLCGHAVSVFDCPENKIYKCLLVFRCNFLCFDFCVDCLLS